MQKATINSRKPVSKRAAQENRRSADKGSQRAKKAANKPASAGAAGFEIPGLHLLELKKTNMFELTLNNGSARWIDFVDTEEKQLQVIEDLYTIFRSLPRYKKLKEKVWTENTKPHEIISYLLKKLAPLAESSDWTVEVYKHRGVQRYCFVTVKYYHNNVITRSNLNEYYYNTMSTGGMYAGDYIVPLDFLPYLLKKDKTLHDLIVDVVALVSKNNSIPLWDEDGDFSEGVQYLINEEGATASNETIYRTRQLYMKGAAAQYLKLLKKRRKVVSFESIRALRNSYKPKIYSSRIYRAIQWLNHGIELAEKGVTMTKAWIPSYADARAFTPSRKFKFVWSRHRHEYVKMYAYKKMLADARKYGEYLPVMSCHYYPTKKEPQYSNLETRHFSAFMREGFSQFMGSNDTYYYGNRIRNEEPPCLDLPLKIENLESQTQKSI